MSPSFFTMPASEKKRKRHATASVAPSKRRKDDDTTERSKDRRRSRASERDESISGSDSESGQSAGNDSGLDTNTSASEHEGETGPERRLRLAERYLHNLRKDLHETGVDAQDLDRDLIAERLKQDVSESKGKLYRYIASGYDFPGATAVRLGSSADSTTCIAAHPPYIYTATKNITLSKWKLPPLEPATLLRNSTGEPQPSKVLRSARRRPVKVKSVRGTHRAISNFNSQHHSAPMLCLAVSPDGRFLATGGADKRLIIWSAETLQSLRVFSQHRDAVLGVAFRRDTNQLYSGSADRTIKTWSLNELAYVETLFGHQDAVVDVAALAQERCLSAGARDRTVRLWKVVEETQLVFRSGGATGERRSGKGKTESQDGTGDLLAGAEGSVERVTFIDEDSFVSGSDNGTLSLWSLHKKKPLFSIPAAHGFDPPPSSQDSFAEMDPDGRVVPTRPEPRWITALTAVPYSDLVLSGSWDGCIRAWQISSDKRRIKAMGIIGVSENDGETKNHEATPLRKEVEADQRGYPARGVANDIAVIEQGDKGKEILQVAVALGKEHRMGRWKKVKGKNGVALFEICKKAAQSRRGSLLSSGEP